MAGYMKKESVAFKMNRYSLFAGIGLGLSATLFTVANKLTTAANAIVLQYTAPVFILILSAILFREKMKKKEVGVVLVTMAGMVLFFLDQLSPGNVVGNILGILAGVFLGLMFVMVGKGGDDDSTRMSGILIAHTADRPAAGNGRGHVRQCGSCRRRGRFGCSSCGGFPGAGDPLRGDPGRLPAGHSVRPVWNRIERLLAPGVFPDRHAGAFAESGLGGHLHRRGARHVRHGGRRGHHRHRYLVVRAGEQGRGRAGPIDVAALEP